VSVVKFNGKAIYSVFGANYENMYTVAYSGLCSNDSILKNKNCDSLKG
jgi:hypothetical protein